MREGCKGHGTRSVHYMSRERIRCSGAEWKSKYGKDQLHKWWRWYCSCGRSRHNNFLALRYGLVAPTQHFVSLFSSASPPRFILLFVELLKFRDLPIYAGPKNYMLGGSLVPEERGRTRGNSEHSIRARNDVIITSTCCAVIIAQSWRLVTRSIKIKQTAEPACNVDYASYHLCFTPRSQLLTHEKLIRRLNSMSAYEGTKTIKKKEDTSRSPSNK